ncbi:unnamed protein product [Clonostachys rosea]|uniref:Uncharacterized protein n=1 Tax=Bionectria ochroleuca TaxID=29856 RepID=A0ABY6UXE8_BIOOC|nr:unnamed protein product [Clonostachys rosea]
MTGSGMQCLFITSETNGLRPEIDRMIFSKKVDLGVDVVDAPRTTPRHTQKKCIFPEYKALDNNIPNKAPMDTPTSMPKQN